MRGVSRFVVGAILECGSTGSVHPETLHGDRAHSD
jgi:hypothetical protein